MFLNLDRQYWPSRIWCAGQWDASVTRLCMALMQMSAVCITSPSAARSSVAASLMQAPTAWVAELLDCHLLGLAAAQFPDGVPA